MKIAWGITGAGHFLLESFDAIKKLKEENKDLKITAFVSRAGEEVIRMYGLGESLRDICGGGYLEEIFLEREQGSSASKTGRFLLQKYDALVVSPATSNSIAKIAFGIADTIVTNAVAQAVKGNVPVFLVPVDIEGTVESRMPFFIDREICMKCELCPPRDQCPGEAITDQIDLLKCSGCGICLASCSYGAIKVGAAKLRIRDVDSRNVDILRRLEGITVLDNPAHILGSMQKLKY
ncbi:MAG TPA: dihydromethanopterin reductase (acceptor) [Candidatus Methanoperedens sp.]